MPCQLTLTEMLLENCQNILGYSTLYNCIYLFSKLTNLLLKTRLGYQFNWDTLNVLINNNYNKFVFYWTLLWIMIVQLEVPANIWASSPADLDNR